MKHLFFLTILLVTISCHAQQPQKFNLGFKKHIVKAAIPDGWIKWGNYELTTVNDAYSGMRAAKITSNEKGTSFGSIAYKIPAKYKGKTIRLEGYMKIENVEDGYAGLLLRIDGKGSSLAFDNMSSKNITGTKDWQKYTIDLNYPKNAEVIFVGGILTGKGKVWLDDFVLTIGGKDIQALKEVEKVLSKAEQDTAFATLSAVSIPELNSENIENLELLGRIWGFLKYHHPAIASGDYNWDNELFRFLPKYLSSKNSGARDAIVLAWIDSFGTIPKCNKCKETKEDAFLKPNHHWMEEQSELLKNKLSVIYKNRSQGEQYYIGEKANVGNPDFKNENPYTEIDYPDDELRLLALYRYWNMIRYFFPYTHLMDKDWNSILKEYIPIFLNAEDELEYELAAIQLIGEIGDTHASLGLEANKIVEWKGSCYPPVDVRFAENKLVVTDYYDPELIEESGLKIGNVIISIDGKSISKIIEEKAKYYPSSNKSVQLRNMSTDLLRSNSEEIKIRYISENLEVKEIMLKLYSKDSLNISGFFKKSEEKSYKMLDNNIGYITLENIRDEDVPNIKKVFKDTRGIIIDIRNYPSTFVPFSLGSYFVSTATPFVKFTNLNLDNPGEFNFTSSLKIPSIGKTYTGKLVVLVNELTQSQAEYTTMAFRAGDNTTVIGSTTAGADGNVSTIYLPGGLRTWISGIGVNYPDGKETQGQGIIPDIEVKITVDGIRNGKDELMEKAVEVILNDKNEIGPKNSMD